MDLMTIINYSIYDEKDEKDFQFQLAQISNNVEFSESQLYTLFENEVNGKENSFDIQAFEDVEDNSFLTINTGLELLEEINRLSWESSSSNNYSSSFNLFEEEEFNWDPWSNALRINNLNEIKTCHRVVQVKRNGDTLDHSDISRLMVCCATSGCTNNATIDGYCKIHVGARRCKVAGCVKGAQTGFLCIAHGGGKPCLKKGCFRKAQSKGLCKTHGGGVRCKTKGCMKSAQSKGYCRSHGGGRRCEESSCTKWAQKSGLCTKHYEKVYTIINLPSSTSTSTLLNETK